MDEINTIAQEVENVLGKHDIYLNTDDFNALHDFISAIMERIRETGE